MRNYLLVAVWVVLMGVAGEMDYQEQVAAEAWVQR